VDNRNWLKKKKARYLSEGLKISVQFVMILVIELRTKELWEEQQNEAL